MSSFIETDPSQMDPKRIEDKEFGLSSPYLKHHQSLINKFNILIEAYLVKKNDVDEMIEATDKLIRDAEFDAV